MEKIGENLEKVGEQKTRIERFIDSFPNNIGLGILLKEYKEGKVSREQVRERWNEIYDSQIETALNTIDAAEDRIERIPKAE